MELNKIYQGDALKVLKTFPDESINCVVTSPPYNKGSVDRKIGKTDSWKQANISYGGFDDNLPEEEYQDWQIGVIEECLRVLKKDGSIFYNHKPRISKHRIIFPHEWLMSFNIRQMIIWDRKNTPTLEPIRFMPTVEYIFWITKEAKTPKFNREAFKYGEVWRISPRIDKEHPATFPEELPAKCITATTDKDDTVLDPFLGSGTTAVVAKKLGRNYIGIELNPEYIKIAEKRLAQQVLI